VASALVLATFVFVGAPGCGASTEPGVVLGTGSDTFESLVDGGEIYIVQGPQGGFHFFGSAHIVGVEPGNPGQLNDPSNPTTEFSVYRGPDRIDVMAAVYTQGLQWSSAAGAYEMLGRLVILGINSDAELDGVEVRFEVSVTDVHGVHVSDARTLTARPHPNNL